MIKEEAEVYVNSHEAAVGLPYYEAAAKIRYRVIDWICFVLMPAAVGKGQLFNCPAITQYYKQKL